MAEKKQYNISEPKVDGPTGESEPKQCVGLEEDGITSVAGVSSPALSGCSEKSSEKSQPKQCVGLEEDGITSVAGETSPALSGSSEKSSEKCAPNNDEQSNVVTSTASPKPCLSPSENTTSGSPSLSPRAPLAPTTCLNCGNTFQGNYCPSCGQRASTHRFKVKEVFTSLAQVFLHGESKFLLTCRLLLVNPGHLVKEYLLGCRQKYYKPLPLLLFLVAIYTFITLLKDDLVSPFDIIQVEKGQDIPYSGSPALNTILENIFHILNNKVYTALSGVVMNVIPFWIFFHRASIARYDGSDAPLNIAEHFFALVYLACINMLMAFISIPFSFIPQSDSIIRTLFFIIPNVYCIIMYRHICSLSWWKSTLLTVIATLVSIILAIVAVIILFSTVYGVENMLKN